MDLNLEARDYQTNLVEVAVKQNTIIYLPTGTGKTLIAVMILKRLSEPLNKSINEGGKISIILVNTLTLISQHLQYLKLHTSYNIIEYGGKKNITSRTLTTWKQQLNSYQIFIMTPKVLLNILEASILTLNCVNLLIFDECHRAVNNHPMRKIMTYYEKLQEYPRIIGLTSTLVNKNIIIHEVISQIKTLEATFRSKVATTNIQYTNGFSTNPKEVIKTFIEKRMDETFEVAIERLQDLIGILENILLKGFSGFNSLWVSKLTITTKQTFKTIINLMKDAIIQIQTLGIFGGRIAIALRLQQLKALKRHSPDLVITYILDASTTVLEIVQKIFENEMEKCNDQLFRFCSQKVQTLISILREYQSESKETLCGIIFVERRITAVILCQILKTLKEVYQEFDYLLPSFILGNNINSSCSNSFEFCSTKKCTNILSQFLNNKINLLVASSVLEEGLDIPTCSLVIMFDKLINYRSYIQSKGRARHKNSFYYFMVNKNDYDTFKITYNLYHKIEQKLCQYINDKKLYSYEALFNEETLEFDKEYNTSFYLDYNKLDLISAINYLQQYCSTLSDHYVTINWILEQTNCNNELMYRVVIKFSTANLFPESIKGPYMKNEKLAKKAATSKICKFLYKVGVLNDNSIRKSQDNIVEGKTDFFEHWPKEELNSNSSQGKQYPRYIPNVCRGQILPNKTTYLHIINLKPNFSTNNSEIRSLMNQLYSSKLCYGILTSKPLPSLCAFSIYVPAGEIIVNFDVNREEVKLTKITIEYLKRFHYILFKKIVEILQSYLIFDNNKNAEILLVVPVQKFFCHYKFNFDVIYESINFYSYNHHTTKGYEQKSFEESYVGKIVTTSNNKFEKWLVIHAYKSSLLSILSVKMLSKLNYSKPQSLEDKTRDPVIEFVISNLCTVQKFPSDLWVQAYLLPIILQRLTSLLQAEELRRRIACEAKLGVIELTGRKWKPLVWDKYKEFVKHSNKEHYKECDRQTVSPIMAMQLTMEALSEVLKRGYSKDFTTQTSITVSKRNCKKNISLFKNVVVTEGPELGEIFKSLMIKNCDVINLERLSTLADSFLKLSISLFITLKYPQYKEGTASVFKGNLISNRNLFYAGMAKKIGDYLVNFAPSYDWKPPCFCIPSIYMDMIHNKQLSINSLANLQLSMDEQLSGILQFYKCHQNIENKNQSTFNPLELHTVKNKIIANSVEALLGVYFQNCGFIGGLKLLEWFNVIPKTENIENILKMQPANPLLQNASNTDIDLFIPLWQKIEEILGYHFKNRAYLLQAFTHSSFTNNRITNCYEKLEFLGDALLDFLITCYIYETCQCFNPGQLTDLKSALVNNTTFASYTVRCGFHKFILFSNQSLSQHINKFVQFQESKNFAIDDEVLILIEENDLYMAEQVDVPKILGDIFEALAAAIFLDCNMNFQTVWDIFYNIMSKEIELFCKSIPKNSIRLIHEAVDAQPYYHKAVKINDNTTMIGLSFKVNDQTKTVYGCGKSKFLAKKAAAKIALRILTK